MFKSKSWQVPFIPKDGDRVTVTGSVSVYAKRGNYPGTVSDFAREMGVSRGRAQFWVKGECMPATRMLLKLMNRTGLTLKQLCPNDQLQAMRRRRQRLARAKALRGPALRAKRARKQKRAPRVVRRRG